MTLNLRELLQEQIQFLYLSSKSFYEGFYGEAKRLAVNVMVLLHDTKKSHSLLSQINLKDVKFHTTSAPWSSEKISLHHGLLTIQASNDGVEYVASLDNIPSPFIRESVFDEWWTEIIFNDRYGNQLKRKDTVLGLANKEDGAQTVNWT